MTLSASASTPLVFAPKPANDFARFYEMYYAECRRRVPRIQAIAAKWRFEDLIPGLSDFDTRFIVEDGMTVQDWCDMSAAVGEVHLDLCERYPHWARNLEHLPGINLTWAELTDPTVYYPEYPQWTFYHSEDPARLAAADRYLADRPWSIADRCFHLKKFCLYYGRYDRKIDPPVNLHEFESKYPLHSRFMHYFCPPLQSALCLLLERPVAGKLETVRLACEMFPELPVFGEMRAAVERHYEVPELYVEPELSRLEDRLEAALDMLRGRLAPVIADIVPDAASKSVAQWKASLARAPVSPAMTVFDASRFSRLMKGRLWFYAHAPAAHFDSIWPIENELLRLRRNFFEIPFGTYWEVTVGEKVPDPAAIVPRLVPSLLTLEEARCTLEFARLTPGHWPPGAQKQAALEIAAVFDGFFHALDKVTQPVAARHAAPAVPAAPKEHENSAKMEAKTMQSRALKLQDVTFGNQWFDEVEDRWDYEDFQKSPEWRAGWISMDCALYNPDDDRVYLGITSFAADIFKAYDRRTGTFVDLGYSRVADPFDAKFHRSLVKAPDGCLYAAQALLHDVDRHWEAPGASIVRYDPRTGAIAKLGVPLPHTYIQALALDAGRERLYGLCFPPEKLIMFDLRTHQSRDLGLIGTYGGMVQGENIALDDAGCVWCNWGLTRAWQSAAGPDALRLCKFDPRQDRIVFSKRGLPHPDGGHGHAKAEAFFNFGDGFMYASGANGSLYRIDPETFDARLLFTPTPDRRSRLSSLVKGEDGAAYGVTGRDGRCEFMRIDYRNGTYEKLGAMRDAAGNALWQNHDIVSAGNGVFYVCENDNPQRSGYLWEVRL